MSEAIASGDRAGVGCLLENGTDPDEPNALGLTPLMQAAARDESGMVADLVSAGADLNATTGAGWTAIHIAARADAPGALAALQAAGADPRSRSTDGMSTLDHAADAGSVAVVEYLIGEGLDPDRRSAFITQGHGYPRSEGLTPLALAVRAGRREAVETLLRLGADVDATTSSGHTPLLIAVFSGQSPELVAALLDAGADPRTRAACIQACSVGDADGLDALEWSRELGRNRLIPLLEASTETN
ncbi:MAG TPA: ankyrin repeat domain-containing protein [Acidimicrobiia bacterium]|nr:ankyrin repeat domain-containing protein [Acidimicrobiia bacterium]